MISATDPIARLYVDDRRRDEILRRAGDRCALAVVTRYGCNGWVSFPSRFAESHVEDGVIRLDVASEESRMPAQALRVGDQVGVSFRRGRTKCLFTSVVTAGAEHGCGAPAGLARITLRWPANLQQMQRRLYERVRPPLDGAIEIVLWSPEPGASGTPCTERPWSKSADPGPPPGARRGRVLNLSAGGIAVVTERGEEWDPGGVFGCSFRPYSGADPLQFDVRLRHTDRTPDGGWTLGFQFLGLETSSAGQCRLAQLASIVTAFRRRHASLDDLPARPSAT